MTYNSTNTQTDWRLLDLQVTGIEVSYHSIPILYSILPPISTKAYQQSAGFERETSHDGESPPPPLILVTDYTSCQLETDWETLTQSHPVLIITTDTTQGYLTISLRSITKVLWSLRWDRAQVDETETVRIWQVFHVSTDPWLTAEMNLD